ncbi:MAG: oligosaccharide flippase family protein [Candidatus Eisenbacteria bacterium]|nr:oligosaccharide flippase family protein [Candidatus Eisenbacteria bacterium]
MHPRKLVRDSVGFAVTQYVVRVALMLRGIIAMRLLDPLSYGAWNALTLLLDYGALAPLSTQQGLDQAVPPRIVAGDPLRLERIKRAGLFNIVVLTALFAAGSLSYLVGSHGRILGFWGVRGLLAALVCIALINLSFYYLTLLRSHGNIGAVSMWFILQGGIGTALGLSLIPVVEAWGYDGAWGLLVGWLAGTAAGVIYAQLQSHGAAPLGPRPSRDSALLLRVGLPMYLYTASSVVLRSVDRLIILRFLGTQKLGYYSLSVIVLGLLLYLPDAIAYVLYPHFLRRYHAEGNRPEAIREQVERSLQVLAVAVPALCGLTFLAARDGAMLLLPRYLPGISAARVMCFAAGAIALANLSSVVLMTLGRHRALVVAAGFFTVAGAAVDYTVVRLGRDITGVAWATLGTFTASGVVLPWLALRGLQVPFLGRIRWLLRFFLPLAASLALAFALDRLMPWAARPGAGVRLVRVALNMGTFAALYLLACFPLVRGLGLRQLLMEFNLPWLGGRRSPETPDA